MPRIQRIQYMNDACASLQEVEFFPSMTVFLYFLPEQSPAGMPCIVFADKTFVQRGSRFAMVIVRR